MYLTQGRVSYEIGAVLSGALQMSVSGVGSCLSSIHLPPSVQVPLHVYSSLCGLFCTESLYKTECICRQVQFRHQTEYLTFLKSTVQRYNTAEGAVQSIGQSTENNVILAPEFPT